MTAATAPTRAAAPARTEGAQAAPPGSAGWEDEVEAPHADAPAADVAVRRAVRHLTRLATLKALVARFEARHLGHRVAMAVARGHEDARPHDAAARWPDSFFEP